jgi:integrase
MQRVSESRKVPPGAPRRVSKGKEQVKVRVDGKDQWCELTASGRFKVYKPEWYARLKHADGTVKLVKLLRDKTASETLLSNLRKQQERILVGLETPVAKSGEEFPKILERFWNARARSGRCTEVYLTRSKAILDLNLKELGISSLDRIAVACGKKSMDHWVDRLLKDGYSNGAINQRIIQCQIFLKWLKEDGSIPHAPTLKKLSEVAKDQRRPITAEEVEKLASAAPWPRNLFYRMLFCTLARKAALRNIEPQDLILDEKSPCLILRSRKSKTKVEVEAPLPVWMLPDLRRLMAESIPGQRLFHRLDRYNLNDELDRDLKTVGIEKYSPDGKLVIHSFRHGGTTELLKSGVSVLLVQRLGGWKSLDQISKVYSHLIPRRDREEIDRVFNRKQTDSKLPQVESVKDT